MKTFYITPARTTDKHKRLAFESGVETVKFDYSSWAEINGAVTAVTVTLESGQAAIANEALASNVKTMTVSTTQTGKSLIKLVATAGNNRDVQWLEVYAKDHSNEYTADYE